MITTYQEIENDIALISEVVCAVQTALQNYGDPEAGWCGDNNLELLFGKRHFAAFQRFNNWARREKQRHFSFHVDAELNKMGREVVPTKCWHTYVLFMDFTRQLPYRNPDVRYIDLHAFGTGWGEMFNGWHNLGPAHDRPRGYRAALDNAVHAALCEESGVAERVLGIIALARATK